MSQLLVFSDQPILIMGLYEALQGKVGFESIVVCETVPVLLAEIANDEVDVALIHVTAGITFAALSEIRRTAPSCKVVLWVHEISTEFASQAVGFGVKGILRTVLPCEAQVESLERVRTGGLWFEESLTERIVLAHRVALTRREGQMLRLLAQGMSNREIAQALVLSVRTIKVYISRLLEKTGAKDRFELALLGLKNMATSQIPEMINGKAMGETLPSLQSLILAHTAGEGAHALKQASQPPLAYGAAADDEKRSGRSF
jgi:DNA-binding NarL/FixJ family response regulator